MPPFCGKSKRLADELLAAGFTNVMRYQLGIPVWRALGGACEIELAGLPHVLAGDRTAVLLDVREADDFRKGTLPGRLPMEDHNTRVIVLAQDPA